MISCEPYSYQSKPQNKRIRLSITTAYNLIIFINQ